MTNRTDRSPDPHYGERVSAHFEALGRKESPMHDDRQEPTLRHQIEPIAVLSMTMLFSAAVFWLMLPTAR